MGTTTVPSHTSTITDSICATEDDKQYRTYQIYYHIILILLVLPCFVALIVMYTLIWRVVRKYASLNSSVKEDSASRNLYTKGLSKLSISGENETSEMKSYSDSEKKFLSSKSTENKPINSRKYVRSRKTILAFILLTVVFFISYIPYLTITILIYTDTITYLAPGEVIFINIIRFTPYINNMANVFIYGCFDMQFRHEVWKLYKSCYPC